MVVHEEKGWITRLGGTLGANGFFQSLKECIERGQRDDYEYFVDHP